MDILFGLVCIGFGVFIGLLIVSAVLRAAVWIANKCVAGSGGGRSYYDEDDWDDWDAYDRPARRRRRGSDGIPEPGLFKGMGIALLVFIAQTVIGFVLALVLVGGMNAGGGNPFAPRGGADPVMQLLVNGVSIVTGFLIWSGLLTALLPTSFPRAMLVTLFLYLILFAIGIVVFGALFVVGVGMGGFR